MTVTKEQKANRRKTLAALRSGKYFQGRDALRRNINNKITHCCLGVASEVCGIAFVERPDNPKLFDFVFSEEKDSGEIPVHDAVEMFGITWGQADHFTTRAIEMNDDEGRDFKYIARKMSKYFKMCDAYNAENTNA